jgi:dihydrodipicolinate synthase/N-acetylneuraminate lyase
VAGPTLDRAAWDALRAGVVIPAHPLALTADRRLDERHQRALTRYYLASGAGGIAVAVHTTQFAIREARFGLHRPVLELAAETTRERQASSGTAGESPTQGADVPATPGAAGGSPVPDASGETPIPGAPGSPILVAGVLGRTDQAVAEASLARDLGYDIVLLQLGALGEAADDELVVHCERVAEVMPLFGFYLQPAVGGRRLGRDFWRRFAAIPNVVAIKVAPFDRYATLDVLLGVATSGRGQQVALYTGNDDAIVADLLFQFATTDQDGSPLALRFSGGLLGHWAVWTSKAVRLLQQVQAAHAAGGAIPADLLELAHQTTDANAAIFDPANRFAGCIPGIHEVLRRQGLMAGRWTLDADEDLSPGQLAEIDRVCHAYPHLVDDAFVAAHIDDWLR